MYKREICIKTWYGTDNYGSNLQAIGLSETLKALGYDVYFLKKFMVIPFMLRHPTMFFARVYNAFSLKKSRKFFTPVPYILSDERKKRLARFKSEYFKEKEYKTLDDWYVDVKKNVIFVAGSDIIWNPAKGYPATSFLDFAYYAKLNRFSYASSVGAQELPKEYYKAYKKYLGSMKGVSVREQAVANMFEPIIQKNVVKVLDPTFLLSKEYWEKFSKKAEISVEINCSNFVLVYFVMEDSRYWDYVKKIKEQTGFKIIVLPMHHSDENQTFDVIKDGTPYEFVWLIKNASFVCTDSFHACVLSIIFHKEFYLIRRKRKSEDDKYNDLLTRYHLTDRIVIDETNFLRNEKVDYAYADKYIESDREDSMNYLIRTLEDCK